MKDDEVRKLTRNLNCKKKKNVVLILVRVNWIRSGQVRKGQVSAEPIHHRVGFFLFFVFCFLSPTPARAMIIIVIVRLFKR